MKVVTVPVTVTATVRVVAIYSAIELTDIVFQHHSVGALIVNGGGCVDDFNDLGYDLWQFIHNTDEIRLNGIDTEDFPRAPDDSTRYDNWPTLWGQEVHEPPDNWLSDMLEHDVLILKGCYTNLPITTEEILENYKTYVTSVRAVADTYPAKLFVMWTVPPRAEDDGGGTAADAQRSRDFSDWMVASLSGGRANLKVFDIFDILADEDNWLKAAYESLDSHPNLTGQQVAGPAFVTFVHNAITAFG